MRRSETKHSRYLAEVSLSVGPLIRHFTALDLLLMEVDVARNSLELQEGLVRGMEDTSHDRRL